jgi:hypothetical protein
MKQEVWSLRVDQQEGVSIFARLSGMNGALLWLSAVLWRGDTVRLAAALGLEEDGRAEGWERTVSMSPAWVLGRGCVPV